MVKITHSSFIWRYFYLLLAILIVTSALLILFALDVYKRRFKNVQPIVPIVPGTVHGQFGRSGISRIPEITGDGSEEAKKVKITDENARKELRTKETDADDEDANEDETSSCDPSSILSVGASPLSHDSGRLSKNQRHLERANQISRQATLKIVESSGHSENDSNEGSMPYDSFQNDSIISITELEAPDSHTMITTGRVSKHFRRKCPSKVYCSGHPNGRTNRDLDWYTIRNKAYKS